MLKRVAIICLAVMLLMQGVALAKSKKNAIPIEERIKIAVEVRDSTNFVDLDTAELLRGMLIDELGDENLYNILDVPAERASDIKTLGDKSADIGELLIFKHGKRNVDDDATFIPEGKAEEPVNIDNRNRSADYVIHCDILGIGTTKGEMDDFAFGEDPGIGIGIGTGSHSRIGVGVFGKVGSTRRTFFATVVNAKLVEVVGGKIVFQKNEIGEALRHRKPSKGYDDVNSEAYLKSIKDAAQDLSKSITKFTKQRLLKK